MEAGESVSPHERDAMQTTDKRVLARRKSKNQIYDALFGLLALKPIADISVTDLITKSGVARSTFYRHFSSVSDVVEGYFTCLDERFDDMIDPEAELLSMEYLTQTFEIYQGVGRSLLIAHKTGLAPRFIQAIIDYHIGRMGNMPANSPERYSLYYYAGAIYCVALEWVASGMKESPEEPARIFLEL